MCTTNKIEIVSVQKFRYNICAKCEANASIILTPALKYNKNNFTIAAEAHCYRIITYIHFFIRITPQ